MVKWLKVVKSGKKCETLNRFSIIFPLLHPSVPDSQGVEAELPPAQERGAGDEGRDAPDGDDGDEGGERRGQRELPVLRHHHEPLQRQHRQRDDRLDTCS